MNPDDILLVQDSFDQLLPIAPAVARYFYHEVFTLDPGIRPMFPHDLTGQEQMLMAMINTVVNGLWHPDALVPVLHELGQRHVHYGVQPSHYATIGLAFMRTLRHYLDRQFTAPVEAAWCAAYKFIADTMQEGSGVPGRLHATRSS